ncbi:uncharacterized protein LOC122056926 [Macadamia integrifolia]|uniref:uncharacterized protein LOC122056926 n=1 Tax=Macadamia integrifolia TaxID=60698 RepID=UPI001C52D36C|nr:uncharacterized protein LOC122056926 [Macadamia integrifolia]
MGNYIPRRALYNNGKVRVILSDGKVHEFDQPLAVAELMLEHPQEVVVEFQSLLTGNRPVPLPADKRLETHKIYLMLPMKGGKAASLTADGARHIRSKAKILLRSQSLVSSAKILPLFARICPSGIGMGMEGDVVVSHGQDCSQLEKPDKVYKLGNLLEDFDEKPEFLSRQLSGKGWKPTLDTIKEKAIEKKVPHWLF